MRYLIQNNVTGLYVSELIVGVMPQWTDDKAKAATWASADYAQAKVAKFRLGDSTPKAV